MRSRLRPGLRSTMVGVPEGAPLVLDLRLESVTEGVLVTGTVTARRRASVAGASSRCRPSWSSTSASCSRTRTASRTRPPVRTRSTGFVDDLIDVEPVVRDAIVLGLPVTPLCRPDCAGLCPDCGQRLDDLRAEHAHDKIDPRWAGLADSPRARARQSLPKPEVRSRSPWLFPSGGPRAATPAPGGRTGKRAPRRLVTCPNRACGQPKLPHTACSNCGQYDGRQVLAV